jgi:hypothetical protein
MYFDNWFELADDGVQSKAFINVKMRLLVLQHQWISVLNIHRITGNGKTI